MQGVSIGCCDGKVFMSERPRCLQLQIGKKIRDVAQVGGVCRVSCKRSGVSGWINDLASPETTTGKFTDRLRQRKMDERVSQLNGVCLSVPESDTGEDVLSLQLFCLQ